MRHCVIFSLYFCHIGASRFLGCHEPVWGPPVGIGETWYFVQKLWYYTKEADGDWYVNVSHRVLLQVFGVFPHIRQMGGGGHVADVEIALLIIRRAAWSAPSLGRARGWGLFPLNIGYIGERYISKSSVSSSGWEMWRFRQLEGGCSLDHCFSKKGNCSDEIWLAIGHYS